MRIIEITIAVLLLLSVGYVLSYAPVLRFTGIPGSQLGVGISGDAGVTGVIIIQDIPEPRFKAYYPVSWMIHRTPLRKPLLWWSDLWGVRGAME